jgi:syntaxin 7
MKAKLNLEWEVVLSLQATKRVSDAKLAKDFQAVLVEFQNAQKIAQDREKFYIPFVAQAVLPTR